MQCPYLCLTSTRKWKGQVFLIGTHFSLVAPLEAQALIDLQFVLSSVRTTPSSVSLYCSLFCNILSTVLYMTGSSLWSFRVLLVLPLRTTAYYFHFLRLGFLILSWLNLSITVIDYGAHQNLARLSGGKSEGMSCSELL